MIIASEIILEWDKLLAGFFPTGLWLYCCWSCYKSGDYCDKRKCFQFILDTAKYSQQWHMLTDLWLYLAHSLHAYATPLNMCLFTF